jgi:hypothetical protein
MVLLGDEGVLELCSVCFGIGAWLALNVPYAHKLVWTHPMELVSDMGRVEARFSPFGDSVSVSAR